VAVVIGQLGARDPQPSGAGGVPQVDYTLLLGYHEVSQTLGSQPVTCAISNESSTLYFNDLLGQSVTIVLGGIYGVTKVQWQKSGGP
jgi:hypothetical protein